MSFGESLEQRREMQLAVLKEQLDWERNLAATRDEELKAAESTIEAQAKEMSLLEDTVRELALAIAAIGKAAERVRPQTKKVRVTW